MIRSHTSLLEACSQQVINKHLSGRMNEWRRALRQCSPSCGRTPVPGHSLHTHFSPPDVHSHLFIQTGKSIAFLTCTCLPYPGDTTFYCHTVPSWHTSAVILYPAGRTSLLCFCFSSWIVQTTRPSLWLTESIQFPTARMDKALNMHRTV